MTTRQQKQHGAALLAAMLTVTLVATLAAGALWQQWRSVEVETAERARLQSAWMLTGALDWARLILREDARSGGADHLGEPWAVALQESRLSTFLAADKGVATDDGATDAFLSGQITDRQALLNVTNLLSGAAVSDADLRMFARLFELLGLPSAQLDSLAENLRFAADTSADNRSGQFAPLLPQQVDQLVWLGLPAASVARLKPYVTILPTRTPVNLNTASAEVLYACLGGLDMATARKMVAERANVPFKSLADAARLTGDKAGALTDSQHAIASRYFEVRGRLRLDRLVVEERSLLQRDGLEVRTLSRDRSAPWPHPGGAY